MKKFMILNKCIIHKDIVGAIKLENNIIIIINDDGNEIVRFELPSEEEASSFLIEALIQLEDDDEERELLPSKEVHLSGYWKAPTTYTSDQSVSPAWTVDQQIMNLNSAYTENEIRKMLGIPSVDEVTDNSV